MGNTRRTSEKGRPHTRSQDRFGEFMHRAKKKKKKEKKKDSAACSEKPRRRGAPTQKEQILEDLEVAEHLEKRNTSRGYIREMHGV